VIARVPRIGATAVVLGLTGTAALLTLGGLPGVAFVVLAVAAVADGLAVPGHQPVARGEQLVDRAAGRPLRLALRWIVLLAAAAAVVEPPVAAMAGAAAAVLVLLVAGGDALDWALQGLRRHPVARGVAGLPVHHLGPPGPAVALTVLPEVLLGGAAFVFRDRPVLVAIAAVVAVGICAGVTAPWVLRARRIRAERLPRLAAAQAYLDDVAPEVVLYYGDSEKSVHEVAMWLPVLEMLAQRTLVLVRNRAAFDALPQTTTPVLCVPSAQDLLSLDLGVLRVGLFVSNIGNNIHLLRQPGLRTVFIGHGDSDKSASVNPFSKVYDEIWVAGAMGRERYHAADAGVRDEAIVEVGRPQLELIRPAAGDRPAVATVLYAPTWEGWNADQDYSSVATHGEALVRGLLAHPSAIRLLYRPHPYTGRRSAAVAAAHRRIVALLEEANAAAGLPHGVGAARDRAGVTGSARQRQLDEVAAGEEALRDLPPTAHAVVQSADASLISCFNVADGLVTDVSSVLSDFLASDKPIAVCDPRGRGRAAFVEQFPATAAALYLAPGAADVEERLEVLAGLRPDPSAGDRATVRSRILGDGRAPAIDRFSAAVDELARRTGRAIGSSAEADRRRPGAD